ncbi:MAG TPA: TonB family protein [Vicinamibacterales bacterium]|nr:TonB family protein [Vicinamibacterales bacterium]
MAEQITAPVPKETDGPLHVRAERPIEVHFSFEQRQSRLGVASSVATHVLLAVLGILIYRYQPARPVQEMPPDIPVDRIVWLAEPGPGGGGGGGGNKTPEPPRPAELPGKDKLTVPVQKKPDPTPAPKVKEPEPPPLEAINIPAMNMAAAQQALPGSLQSANVASESLGSGSGTGAGTGTGSGVGPGQGSGLGPGFGGGTGGGAYRPGAGITLPRVLREVRPQYTADAMRAKVQGAVWLECIVLPDGTVGDVRVTKSLDPVFGLDQEAIKAAKMWRFSPGIRQGEPVPVIITIELTFTLR